MSEEKPSLPAPALTEDQLLRNAMITTASKMFSYFQDNKNNISKVDLFKVFFEASVRSFDLPFPPEMKKFLFDEEEASELMKDMLALQLHMIDIVNNKVTRESLTEWKRLYLDEKKENENE